MARYEALSRAFFEAMDSFCLAPPGDRVSETMRGEAAVLRLLMREGRSLTPGEICKALGMTSPRVAAVLGSLEKKRLVVRESDQADRRRVPAALTQRGVDFCREKQERVVAEFSLLLRQLGEEDAEHFVRILRRVLSLQSRRRSGKEARGGSQQP